MASYSIRSASVAREDALKTLMTSIVAKFNQKYTIALDCNSDIEIVAGLYSNENQKDKSLILSTFVR